MTAEDYKPAHKSPRKCPFWSATAVKCTICENGLFIPLDRHAEAFCKTCQFPACMQYTLYSENHIFLAENVRKSEINRRKFIRVPSSQRVLVTTRAANDGVTEPPYEIKTIDLSTSGMRVALKKPLLPDALVQFSFDDSFPLKIEHMTGLVEWCNKQVDEPGYQAGLSFQDRCIIDLQDRLLVQQDNRS